MRVVFDVTTCAKPRRGGIATYGWELVSACGRVAPEHEYVLALRSHRWFKRHLLADLLPGAPRRLLVDGFHRLTLGALDVLHGTGVRLPAVGAFPRTAIIHDLNVFEAPELTDEQWRVTRQQRIRETVARATLVLTYSEQGAASLQQHLGVPRERLRVVPLGVDTTRFRPDRPAEQRDGLAAQLAAHGLAPLLERPFVLMLGDDTSRKNHAGLVRAFARAALPDDWMLALADPRPGAQDRWRAALSAEGVAPERLVVLPWIELEHLPALLGAATIYACASLHEGFGLPVVEAQACGTSVVSSDRGALPETVGDAGLLADPEDGDAFGAALRRVAEDDALRAELEARGPARIADGYTWDVVARRTLDVLEEAARGPVGV